MMEVLRRTLEAPEVREAWAEYVEEIRGVHAILYPEVEDWAWRRLQRRLDEYDEADSAGGAGG